MAIEISCPQCAKKLRVRPEYAGAAMLCPGCSTSLTIPGGPGPRREDRPPEPPSGRPPRRQRVVDEDDGEHDSGYKPCPKCGGRHAQRVTFTFWGSFYGPALLTHVRCPDCGTAYNGKTGGSNLIWAVGCVTLPLLGIAVIIGGLVFLVMSMQ
jgi:hypothetical protein